MRCATCYYAEPVYDKSGMVTGFSCKGHNSVYISWADAQDRYCGQYAERDD